MILGAPRLNLYKENPELKYTRYDNANTLSTTLFRVKEGKLHGITNEQ